MKTALGLLVGLALVSLSACNSDDSASSSDGSAGPWDHAPISSGDWSTPGEPCPDFQGFPTDDSPVMCGGDAFEILEGVIAWREIPESAPCPDTTCVSMEIVTDDRCPGVSLYFAEELTSRDPRPEHPSGDITNAKPGVRYTLRFASSQESVSARPASSECFWPM